MLRNYEETKQNLLEKFGNNFFCVCLGEPQNTENSCLEAPNALFVALCEFKRAIRMRSNEKIFCKYLVRNKIKSSAKSNNAAGCSHLQSEFVQLAVLQSLLLSVELSF